MPDRYWPVRPTTELSSASSSTNVWEGLDRLTGKHVFMKFYNSITDPFTGTVSAESHVLREVKIHKDLSNTFPQRILCFLDFYLDSPDSSDFNTNSSMPVPSRDAVTPQQQDLPSKNHLVMILERADCSLADFIDTTPLDMQRTFHKPYTRLCKYIAWGAIEGIACMHSSGTIHAAIRPQCVQLVRKADLNSIVLSDFTRAYQGTDSTQDQSPAEISADDPMFPYWAPEVLAGNVSNSKADVFSMGIVIYEKLYGRNPYAFTPAAAREALEVSPFLVEERREAEAGYTNSQASTPYTSETASTHSSPNQTQSRTVRFSALSRLVKVVSSLKQNRVQLRLDAMRLQVGPDFIPEPGYYDAGPAVRDMLKGMLKLNPDYRPDAQTVLKHPWFLESDSLITNGYYAHIPIPKSRKDRQGREKKVEVAQEQGQVSVKQDVPEVNGEDLTVPYDMEKVKQYPSAQQSKVSTTSSDAEPIGLKQPLIVPTIESVPEAVVAPAAEIPVKELRETRYQLNGESSRSMAKGAPRTKVYKLYADGSSESETPKGDLSTPYQAQDVIEKARDALQRGDGSNSQDMEKKFVKVSNTSRAGSTSSMEGKGKNTMMRPAMKQNKQSESGDSASSRRKPMQVLFMPDACKFGGKNLSLRGSASSTPVDNQGRPYFPTTNSRSYSEGLVNYIEATNGSLTQGGSGSTNSVSTPRDSNATLKPVNVVNAQLVQSPRSSPVLAQKEMKSYKTKSGAGSSDSRAVETEPIRKLYRSDPDPQTNRRQASTPQVKVQQDAELRWDQQREPQQQKYEHVDFSTNNVGKTGIHSLNESFTDRTAVANPVDELERETGWDYAREQVAYDSEDTLQSSPLLGANSVPDTPAYAGIKHSASLPKLVEESTSDLEDKSVLSPYEVALEEQREQLRREAELEVLAAALKIKQKSGDSVDYKKYLSTVTSGNQNSTTYFYERPQKLSPGIYQPRVDGSNQYFATHGSDTPQTHTSESTFVGSSDSKDSMELYPNTGALFYNSSSGQTKSQDQTKTNVTNNEIPAATGRKWWDVIRRNIGSKPQSKETKEQQFKKMMELVQDQQIQAQNGRGTQMPARRSVNLSSTTSVGNDAGIMRNTERARWSHQYGGYNQEHEYAPAQYYGR